MAITDSEHSVNSQIAMPKTGMVLGKASDSSGAFFCARSVLRRIAPPSLQYRYKPTKSKCQRLLHCKPHPSDEAPTSAKQPMATFSTISDKPSTSRKKKTNNVKKSDHFCDCARMLHRRVDVLNGRNLNKEKHHGSNDIKDKSS